MSEQQDNIRALPFALGPEKSVLSSILQEPLEYLPKAISLGITKDHFYLPAHSTLYAFLLELSEAGQEIELVSLTQRLHDRGQLDRVGGPAALTDIYNYSPSPSHFAAHLEMIFQKHRARRGLEVLTQGIEAIYDSPEESDETISKANEKLAGITSAVKTGKDQSHIVRGVNNFPTEIPLESVILGDGWIRKGDIATFISTAGAGKSVATVQAAMAWGIGLPYLGIRPPRPLRILLFSGEDDETTIGQIREGLLENSEALTSRKLSACDLEPLNRNLRTEFAREYVGPRFHSHLAGLIKSDPVDLVIINPLLSYVGGEIVAMASEFLRAGLMPILQEHGCASLIAHHTGKMAKDGWDNTDDTYSAIGGGEMANIPRTILTLRPTPADGLFVLRVSKRQTTGWKDSDGRFTNSYFVRRTNDPTRPAWLPVESDEAEEMLGEVKGKSTKGREKKVKLEDVLSPLRTGDMERQALMQWICRKTGCSDKTAFKAIDDAKDDEQIESYFEPNPNGGKAVKWFKLPQGER